MLVIISSSLIYIAYYEGFVYTGQGHTRPVKSLIVLIVHSKCKK